MKEVLHRPVMVEEVVGFLLQKEAGVYVDCTLGSGGHTEEILRRCSNCIVIGIDRDQEAIERAKVRLPEDRVVFVRERFSEVDAIVQQRGYKEVDGVLMDLGLSMEQLKDPERGFSFSSEAPLDMRMDRDQALTAQEIVNRWPEGELERIIRQYGEERRSKAIARQIVKRRKPSPIKTCRELAALIEGLYGTRRTKIHPATKTFQALRIVVNSELEQLQKALRAAVKVLRKGGRLVVISYHSLEDRIVKNFFREGQKEGLLKVLTKKVVRPSEEEKRTNPSSRSAKLRAAERC
jgi:16S rRNA (cytosine1402-N4)-methyltransferase